MEQLAKTEPIIELQLNTEKFETNDCAFNEFFLEAVDRAFSLLGNQAKELLYRYLDIKCGVSQENIPNQIESFSRAIEAVFGQSAQIIEIYIMRNLHQKVPTFTFSGMKASNLSFSNYVEAFRSSCSS